VTRFTDATAYHRRGAAAIPWRPGPSDEMKPGTRHIGCQAPPKTKVPPPCVSPGWPCYAARGGRMEINWRHDVDQVLKDAKAQDKPVLLDFSAAPM